MMFFFAALAVVLDSLNFSVTLLENSVPFVLNQLSTPLTSDFVAFAIGPGR
jgi:hypothetical protein